MAAYSRTGLQTPNAFITGHTVFMHTHTVLGLCVCTKCHIKQQWNVSKYPSSSIPSL